MKIAFLIPTFFFTGYLKSQVPVAVFTEALQSKKYSVFEAAFKKALKKDSLIDYGNTLSREILKGYKEVYYEIFDRYPLVGNNHFLKMIVKGNEMIWYHFSFVQVKKEGEKRIFTTVPVDTFANASKYSIFKSEFRKIYKADIHETDLWKYTIVGQFCGLRTNPGNLKDYDEMNALVNSDKKDSLMKWLQSANLEKQMFGLWGYDLLLQKQRALSVLEWKLIAIIMAKKAKGNVCEGGCNLYYLTPGEFAERYHLDKLLQGTAVTADLQSTL